jgi:hypothetical protein
MTHVIGGAVISPCERYRYVLWRELVRPLEVPGPLLATEPREPHRLLFVMLNPSTADQVLPDATVTRCIGFGRREKATTIAIVNLFAFRSTDPSALRSAQEAGIDIVGLDTDAHIGIEAGAAHRIVVAWGALGSRYPRRVAQVVELLRAHHAGPLYAFGSTNGGQPLHPLYLAADRALERWELP